MEPSEKNLQRSMSLKVAELFGHVHHFFLLSCDINIEIKHRFITNHLAIIKKHLKCNFPMCSFFVKHTLPVCVDSEYNKDFSIIYCCYLKSNHNLVYL